MYEVNASAKKAYSRIGFIYTIFSVAVTLMQLAVSAINTAVNPYADSYDIQIVLNSGTLYIVGLIVFAICFREPELTVTPIEKHRMRFKDVLKSICMCYALLIISNIIGTLITTLIGMAKGSPIINPVEELAMSMSVPVMFLVTVICAPVFEELFFRKFIIDRVVKYGEWVAVLVSGIMFGLFHGNLSQLPYALAIGVFFGIIYVRTGHIGYTMLFHAIVNFFGSIASVVVLKFVDPDMYMNIMNSTSEADILNSITMDGLVGLMVLLVYEVIVMIVVIIGIILWILEWKKISFKIQDEELPVNGRVVTALSGSGMIVFGLFWLIMIAIATI